MKFTNASGGKIISISIAHSTTGYGDFDKKIKATVKPLKLQ